MALFVNRLNRVIACDKIQHKVLENVQNVKRKRKYVLTGFTFVKHTTDIMHFVFMLSQTPL